MRVNVLNLVDHKHGGVIVTFVFKENANFEEIRKTVMNEYCLSFGKKTYESIIRERFCDFLIEIANTEEMNYFTPNEELER